MPQYLKIPFLTTIPALMVQVLKLHIWLSETHVQPRVVSDLGGTAHVFQKVHSEYGQQVPAKICFSVYPIHLLPKRISVPNVTQTANIRYSLKMSTFIQDKA